MLKNNLLIQYRPEFLISRNIGEKIIKIPVPKMLFTETLAFKFNLNINLIIILQFIKKNKYEQLVKRNGVITFFFANFAKLMTSSHVLLKLVRKCFLEIFYNILLFEYFFFHFTSSGKGGGFLSK